MGKLYRGICERCNQLRLLNAINLCVDCTTEKDFAENQDKLIFKNDKSRLQGKQKKT